MTKPQSGQTRSRPSRGRMVAVVAAALAVVALLGGGMAWWFDWPSREGPRLVTDKADVISLTIPKGWTEETEHDARQIVPGDSGDGWARVPDIVLLSEPTTPDDYGSVVAVHVYVELAPDGVSIGELHNVSQGLSKGFKDGAVAVASPVRKWQSLASRSNKYGQDEAVTVLSDNFVVTFHAFARDGSALDSANSVIATLQIHEQ